MARSIGSNGQHNHSKNSNNNGFFRTVLGMATCVMVGFILGSMKSYMSITGGWMMDQNIGMMEKKKASSSHTTAHSAAVVSRGGSYDNRKYENNTSMRSSSSSISSTSTTAASVIEEIIPPNLLSKYAPHKLQFNVTRSMLRQSRPVVGNTKRLQLFFEKLHAGQCTTVLFLGGSVTAGHNGGGPANAYPARVVEWLNERYPCTTTANSNGTSPTGNAGGGGKGDEGDELRGRHEYRKTHAADSITHFSLWKSVTSIPTFDMVFIEFNIGDSFVNGLSHALEDKGAMGATKEYQGCWYFEVLLRRLLLLRKPDPVAIVTFNADYIGRVWATFPPWQDPVSARKMLFRSNQEPLKIWVSSMYEIPVFSAVLWMLPLSGKRGTAWQFNGTHNPYSTSKWHADACCHPKPPGHLILSLVIAYCIVEEEKVYYNDGIGGGGQGIAEEEDDAATADFTMDEPPTLRDPLYLSPEEDDMYVNIENGKRSGVAVDFSDPNGEESWKNTVVAEEGWTWYADNKDKDKYGFIANGIDGGQHIAVSLSGGEHGRVEVSYVVSYENFGIALAWLDQSIGNVRGLCNGKEEENQRTPKHQLLNAIWDQPASVPKVEILDQRLEAGENKTLHICLAPRDDAKCKGTENKFKLLGVRVF